MLTNVQFKGIKAPRVTYELKREKCILLTPGVANSRDTVINIINPWTPERVFESRKHDKRQDADLFGSEVRAPALQIFMSGTVSRS